MHRRGLTGGVSYMEGIAVRRNAFDGFQIGEHVVVCIIFRGLPCHIIM